MKKRQWGTEKNYTPLHHLHETPSIAKIAISRIGIVITITFWLLYLSSVIIRQYIEGPKSYNLAMETFGYLTVVTFLTLSALLYLIARQGAFQQFSKHVRVPKAKLDEYFANNQPSITVLVPSYSEEYQVVRKTLISALLQEYPSLRVVLLLDDDPAPTDAVSKSKLKRIRNLKNELTLLLSKPYVRFSNAFEEFHKNKHKSKTELRRFMVLLSRHYHWAGDWLEMLRSKETLNDHVDVFFTKEVIGSLAANLHAVGDALHTSHEEGATLSFEILSNLVNRLVWIFGTQIEIFERKRFANISHEPNKAMNLNAYIGLMGNSYEITSTKTGNLITPAKNNSKQLITIPDSDFILTLDADSLLLKEYCMRLVYFIEQPNNHDVAVTQTPYSSFRGAATRIERLAGATTDIQHIIHQGMSHYQAAFWVGANAIIRKKALEDIKRVDWIGGFEVKRYIQDNTVIEDTESSIDLALHGWRIVNYPERLSYSATPPDFGSLIIQRRRWANGGLLILPKLITQYQLQKNASLLPFLLRVNYMASIAWSNLGLLFLLAYPYDGRLLSPYILLAASPYFILMASDLLYCRYRLTDIFRVYGFNLILLPVNIAGVLKSIEQAITAKKIPFARTPKVSNRTAAELPFVLSPLAIIAFSVFTAIRNINSQEWGNALFAGFNAFSATWATLSYIGIKNIIIDIAVGLFQFIQVEVKAGSEKGVKKTENRDWQSILYEGSSGNTAPSQLMDYITIKEKKAK